MIPPRHLLVFRLSSLGDVAMTVPVLKNLLQQHPALQVTMVSTAFAAPLFQNMERLQFYAADLNGAHKGVAGMYRLSKELKALNEFDAIADLHNVLRTKILRGFFCFSGKPIAVIDKGRKEKKELTRRQNKILRPLRTTFQRYADVLEKAGLPLHLDVAAGLLPKPSSPKQLLELQTQGYSLIGLAPFAQYKEKTYPLSKMKEVVRMLTADKKNAVFLFGGRGDKEVLNACEAGFPNVFNWAGVGLFTELAAIANLDMMISMDSANMHLASLYGVPAVSVWGGSHPYLGFMGWGQTMENAVQIDLPCRPSSVFGNKPCVNSGACLEGISPVLIYEKATSLLNTNSL